MHNNNKNTPSIIKISELTDTPKKALVSIAGLLVIKQRPSTASGVTFLSLEDESGTANVICWEKIYEEHRSYILNGNLLKITGNIEKQGELINIIANKIENLSYLLEKIDQIP